MSSAARPAIPYLGVPVLWLVSFFFSMPLIEPYEVSRLLSRGAAVAALGVVLADPANRSTTISFGVIAALVLAFTGWCGLTFFWSVSPFVSVIAWGTFLLLPVWFVVFALMPVSTQQIMLVLRLVVAACAALALWAFAQYFVFTSFLDEYGTIAYPFADPNNFAALLNIGVFVALGLWFQATATAEKRLQALAAFLMLAAMMMIGSRMGVMALCLGLAVFALLARGSGRFSFKLAGGLVAVGVLALAVTALFNDERVTSIQRLGYFLIDRDNSSSARLMIWSSAVALIQQFPWVGAGLGSFFLLYPGVRAPAEIYSAGLMAHADPLQFWVEAGLPAVILLYAVLIAVLARFAAFLKVTKPGDAGRLLPLALFCALLTLALHIHVSFHLFVAALLAMTGVLLGVLVRLLPPGRSFISFRTGIPMMVCLMALCAFTVMFQSCLFSEMHANQAVNALEKGDMQTFGAKVNQASREGFGMNPRPYVLASTVPLGILQTSPLLSSAEKQALFDQADNLIDRGLAASPVNAGAYFSKALLYGAVGRGAEAQGFLEKTLEIDPMHPQAKAMLGR